MKPRTFITLAMVLGTALCCIVPSWAGFKEGEEALEHGDYATALKEFRPLAERSNADAQLELGLLYHNGLGVAEDQKEAVKWYLRAAEQGNAFAQWLLGLQYQRGEGVSQDYQQAANWYRRAAEQGDDRGQQMLAGFYLEGWGVPQDYVLAHMWGNLAAAQGNPIGKFIRDEVAKKMTPAQVAESQKLAREWKLKKP